jgi:omega-hydroxy-beta-dihydromenaquinone-9 sulfotransferase
VSEEKKGSSGVRLRLLRGAWRSISCKVDPSRSRLTFQRRFLSSVDAAIQSLLHALQQKGFADRLATVVPPAPIFVLGFWRSGTTLLHELLCCDSRFGFPSTYACLNPSHFLLSEPWVRKRLHPQVLRPMDNLRYSWSSPQEDEFALLALGAPSPYEVLLVPSRMQHVSELLDFNALPLVDQNRWSAAFSYFLKLLTVQQGKRMILKSPPHGYRMRILQRQFPEARYVVIERNPFEVFASNLKLWEILTDRYSLEHCSADQLEEFVLSAYLLHEEAIEEGAQHAKPGSLAFIRYEDLEREPVKQVSRLYNELSLGDFVPVRPRLEEYLAKVSGHARNRLTLFRQQKKKVEDRWGKLIAQKGYKWPESYIDLSSQ